MASSEWAGILLDTTETRVKGETCRYKKSRSHVIWENNGCMHVDYVILAQNPLAVRMSPPLARVVLGLAVPCTLRVSRSLNDQ